MRYECYRFPNYDGKCFKTNNWWRVRIWVAWRQVIGDTSELRVIDTTDGEHYVW